MDPSRISPRVALVLFAFGCLAPDCGETVKLDTSPDTGDTTAGPVDYDDADGDLIMDIHEGSETDDEDGDGTPNYLDTESDGDSINDRIEAGDTDPYTLPIDSETVTSRPKDYFAHASKLPKMLMAGHGKVKLESQEMARLRTWMDVYAQRSGSFSDAQEQRLVELRVRMAKLMAK